MLRRIQHRRTGTADTAAEVFGTCSRGDRIHVIACRVEQRNAGNETRWLVMRPASGRDRRPTPSSKLLRRPAATAR